MKLISKIAFVIGFILFVSSCQKENTLSPGNCASRHDNTLNLRISNHSNTNGDSDSNTTIGTTDQQTDDGVVGGGDDDRDGGGKKIKKGG